MSNYLIKILKLTTPKITLAILFVIIYYFLYSYLTVINGWITINSDLMLPCFEYSKPTYPYFMTPGANIIDEWYNAGPNCGGPQSQLRSIFKSIKIYLPLIFILTISYLTSSSIVELYKNRKNKKLNKENNLLFKILLIWFCFLIGIISLNIAVNNTKNRNGLNRSFRTAPPIPPASNFYK